MCLMPRLKQAQQHAEASYELKIDGYHWFKMDIVAFIQGIALNECQNLVQSYLGHSDIMPCVKKAPLSARKLGCSEILYQWYQNFEMLNILLYMK